MIASVNILYLMAYFLVINLNTCHSVPIVKTTNIHIQSLNTPWINVIFFLVDFLSENMSKDPLKGKICQSFSATFLFICGV